MDVKNRLLEFIKSENIAVSEFERKSGLSNGYVSKIVNKIGNDKLFHIKEAYPNLNISWLTTGEGEMLLAKEVSISNSDVIMIPVLNLDARGGFASNSVLEAEYTTGLMPFSREFARSGDIVIQIYGDSMAPKYPSGSMVLIREVELWREYLELGCTYVIELIDERRLIKNIVKSDYEDCFILESTNPKYEQTVIKKEMINAVFRVIMSIQRETI